MHDPLTGKALLKKKKNNNSDFFFFKFRILDSGLECGITQYIIYCNIL